MPSGKRRKKDFDAKAQAEMEQAQAAVATDEPKPISEVLPDVMAALPAPASDSQADQPQAEPTEAGSQEPEHEPSPRVRQKQPPFDRFSRNQSLGGDLGKLRLGRDDHFKQIVIKFDEKPPKEIRDEMTENGWRYREPPEKYWTKQLGDRPAATHLDAERFFEHIADRVRELTGQEQARSM